MDFVFAHQVGILHDEWFINHVYLRVQLSGGPVDGLVEALQSLGVSEGVRLLRNSQPREDKQSTGTGSYSDRNLPLLTRHKGFNQSIVNKTCFLSSRF